MKNTVKTWRKMNKLSPGKNDKSQLESETRLAPTLTQKKRKTVMTLGRVNDYYTVCRRCNLIYSKLIMTRYSCVSVSIKLLFL